MDIIKLYFNKAIDWTKNWYISNWNGGMFNRGKTIFVSFVAFFIIWKLLYEIFV